VLRVTGHEHAAPLIVSNGWDRNSLAASDDFVSITPARADPMETLSGASGRYEG
jgi:hypothetical protein